MNRSNSAPQGARGTAETGAPAKAPEDQPSPERPSIIAIVASALAAVTSTVALSFLGVAGTIIGVALSSVLTVIGRYIYSSYLERTHERVRVARLVAQDKAADRSDGTGRPATVGSGTDRTRVDHAAADTPAGPDDDPDGGRAVVRGDSGDDSKFAKLRSLWDSAVQRHGLGKIIATVAGVFVLLLGALTVVEAIVGKPVADVVRNEPGSGTSVFGGSSGDVDPAPEDSEDPGSPGETTEPSDGPIDESPNEPLPDDTEPPTAPEPPAPDDPVPPDSEPDEPAPEDPQPENPEPDIPEPEDGQAPDSGPGA